ncbi:helix-turn-helix domain-containing protein [Christensenellaceae bacterium OttesenSCG-928-K19]|nr:helix-turn-helix domain-containing protein [Christensenellaceae bacterium OttesenSCG-928-K19]
MAIGDRIKFFRNLRGMTQKWLGMTVGFDEKTADVRMAQYESGTRTPKEKLTDDLARTLDVSPQALTVPDIDTYNGLMHTLFALEDMYGLKISQLDGTLCLTLDRDNPAYRTMFDMLNSWLKESEKLQDGEITTDEYDEWRYKYPEAKVSRDRE